MMAKETTRKYFMKIVETWLKNTSETYEVDESELEIMCMLIYDSKSIIRCDACLQFQLKCTMSIQEDDDPIFDGLLVLSSNEKLKITLDILLAR